MKGSKSFAINSAEVLKAVKAFFWGASSLGLVLLGVVIALPNAEIPGWLVWLVPSAPALNALLYGFQQWLSDNSD